MLNFSIILNKLNTAPCGGLHFLTTAFDNKLHVIEIFIDVAKAFDFVDHSLLLCKLEHYGIL